MSEAEQAEGTVTGCGWEACPEHSTPERVLAVHSGTTALQAKEPIFMPSSSPVTPSRAWKREVRGCRAAACGLKGQEDVGISNHSRVGSRPCKSPTTQGRESGQERETGAAREIPIEAENGTSASGIAGDIYFLKGPET